MKFNIVWKLRNEKLRISQQKVEQNEVKFVTWSFGIIYMYILGTWPFSVQCHFESFGALCSKWHVTRKRVTVEQNGVKFGTWGCCNMFMGCLWPFIVQGHFGVIWSLCLKMTCNLKIAGRGMKHTESWESVVVVISIWGTLILTLELSCSRSFWGQSAHLSENGL